MRKASEARRAIYSGRVQGVGFRYTARRIAQSHPVTGFVKNLRDGRVELVVEGSTSDVEAVLREIAAAMSGHIEEVEVESRAASGEYQAFEVEF
jgi:acylphosphatase